MKEDAAGPYRTIAIEVYCYNNNVKVQLFLWEAN